jgi:putative transposase
MKIIRRGEISEATEEIFHVLNRGVDNRKIFLDEKDYFRFIHNLFEFNDPNPILNLGYRFNRGQSIDLRNQYNLNRKPRKLIVEILAFCLMPNHFHLLLRQKEKGGITKFMRKLGAGYANYFNQKYQRLGTLFQGRYKLILIKNEPHFIHLPYYIHFNPLDLIMPEWREKRIKNYQKAIKFLASYRWSSHLDYIGKKNFPSVTQREFLLKIFNGSENYRKMIKNWLKEMDLTKIKNLILE